MIRFNRFNQLAALSALLLCFSFNASADEAQEANKLFKRGQNAAALGKVDALSGNQTKDVQARFLKALILTEQNQTEEAIRIFTALSEDYPELPEPYNNLAVIYAAQGQYDKAKVALEKALRTHPSYATAHENLGDIYAKMASQAYDRALQLDRSNVSSKTKLALIKELNTSIKPTKTQLAANTTTAAPSSAASSPAPAIIISALPPTAGDPVASKPVVVTLIKNNSNDDVLQTVNEWAKAWSAKNATKYLSFYAKDFKTPNNESRSEWEKQRRERISKPQPIVVSISNAKVVMHDANRASVTFVQSYHSGALKSITRKTLGLIKNNSSWQIATEQTGNKQ
jgi:tetratricopeptide (TPR) repeat protein